MLQNYKGWNEPRGAGFLRLAQGRSISSVVDADASTAGVRRTPPITARYPSHGGLCRSFRGEQTIKDVPDVVSFFGVWNLFRPPLRTTREIFVIDGSLRLFLEAVYPRISNTVGKLFLLAPENRFGEVRL